jgi:hypothetical protein
MPIDDSAYVLAITRNNQAVHVGRADTAAEHFTLSGTSALLDYFDGDGRPLMLLRSRNGTSLFEVNPAGTQVDDEVLLERIDTALAHMQVVQNQQGQASDEVPRPLGSLEEVLRELGNAFDNLVTVPTKGNWLHNLSHAAGFAH